MFWIGFSAGAILGGIAVIFMAFIHNNRHDDDDE